MSIRKIVCVILASVIIASMYPATVIAKTQTFTGYDEHDIQALLAFAAQQPHKNELNWSVNISPSKWICITWVEVNGVKYLETFGVRDVNHRVTGSLDLTKCKRVEFVHSIANSNLTSLRVKSLKKLEYLAITDCKVSSIDLSGLSGLTTLHCGRNKLASLDLTDCSKLEMFSCNGNKLKKINVSTNPALEYLDCSENNISKLNITKNPKLTYIECWDTKLKSEDDIIRYRDDLEVRFDYPDYTVPPNF